MGDIVVEGEGSGLFVGTNGVGLAIVSVKIGDDVGVAVKAAGGIEPQPVRIKTRLTRAARRLKVCKIIFHPFIKWRSEKVYFFIPKIKKSPGEGDFSTMTSLF